MSLSKPSSLNILPLTLAACVFRNPSPEYPSRTADPSPESVSSHRDFLPPPIQEPSLSELQASCNAAKADLRRVLDDPEKHCDTPEHFLFMMEASRECRTVEPQARERLRSEVEVRRQACHASLDPCRTALKDAEKAIERLEPRYLGFDKQCSPSDIESADRLMEAVHHLCANLLQGTITKALDLKHDILKARFEFARATCQLRRIPPSPSIPPLFQRRRP